MRTMCVRVGLHTTFYELLQISTLKITIGIGNFSIHITIDIFACTTSAEICMHYLN